MSPEEKKKEAKKKIKERLIKEGYEPQVCHPLVDEFGIKWMLCNYIIRWG